MRLNFEAEELTVHKKLDLFSEPLGIKIHMKHQYRPGTTRMEERFNCLLRRGFNIFLIFIDFLLWYIKDVRMTIP